MKRKRVLLLLCILNCTLQLFAQQINVQGVVYDPSGETVPGANVSMKSNPAVGTVTDIDGNFSLKASVGDVLVFTFIGYEPIEYKLTAADTNLKVRFTDSSELLDEVVVVGYGVQKKSVLSSAVSRVTSEELDKGNPTNIQNALKGKVSGVQIISNSGQPGAESKIRIRGTGTVNNSDPLYIVDGMPSESGISHLNPSDIESIEVLKDAASAAIYGARGANGVVLITTKKGTKGKATLNYEFTYGIQNPSKKVDLLGSADYQMLMNEMAANAGKDPYFPTVSSVNTDWQKELQNKNAPIMNHKVSLSGGTDNSTYYASFGYVKQEGIYAKGHADYERYNVRLNYNNVLLDTKSRNWLNKISFGAIASYSKSIQTGNTIGNSEAAGLITSMNMLPPTEPVYQTDPAILEQYAVTYPNHVIAPNGLAYNIIEMREITNPLAAMQVSHNQRTMPQNFGANFNLDVDLLPGLKFKTTYGAEWVFNSIKNVTPVYELNATSKNATSKVEDKKRESSYWQWENVLSYTKSFGRHNIGALFGTSMSSYHYSNLEAEDYNLLVVDIDKGYIDTATAPEEQSKVWGGAEDHRIASIFGRINYNYDEKYLFEAVVRRDGSSNFSREHQYATFPSVSLGWVLTREKFMENRPSWLDFAKIRLSWGQNGNERIGSFAYTSMMSQGKNAVINGKVYTGMLPSGYAVFIKQNSYNECATLCQKILNGDYGTYSITDDYRDIYSINNVECPEVVMALAMEVGQVNTGWMRNMPFMPYNCWDYFGGTYSQSGWNCVCLAPSWDNSGNVQPYGGTDNPKSFLTDYGDKLGAVYERFHDKDIRKQNYVYNETTGNYQGIFLKGAIKANYGKGAALKADADRDGQDLVYVDQVGTFLNLGRNLETVMSPRWGETNSGVRLVRYPVYPESAGIDFQNIDEVEFRLSEVVYTLAECKMRAGDTEGAKELVYRVKTRYFTDKSALEQPGPGFTSFDMDWMLSEWGLEFLGEGRRRRTDLRRFDKFTQGQWWFFGRATDDGLSYPAKRDRKYEWYPLPQSALMVNPGLVQNPNY